MNTYDQAHRIVEEAQLFIEAAYACHDVIAEQGSSSLSIKSAGML